MLFIARLARFYLTVGARTCRLLGDFLAVATIAVFPMRLASRNRRTQPPVVAVDSVRFDKPAHRAARFGPWIS